MAFVGFACTNTDERLPIAAEPEPTSAMLQTRSVASSNYEVVPNPYSLANMQAVYNELVGNGTLQPTDLYVRFLPQDSLQMNRLKSDLNLELFDYPLDLQIEDGEVYVDPTIPSGQLTWQYTTVPANFVFPTGITHQILEQCYIPRDDQGVVTRSDGTMVNIEEAAFERVNYPAYSEPDRLFGLFEGKYPQGTITVYDDVEGEYVPVTGVKVRCHIVVKWATDFTDDNGFYKMTSKFPVGPHYAIVFDNSKGFDIWGNWGPLARANYNMGWHSKNGFSKAIPAGSQAWPWAVVNNAGYEYYTMCQQTGIAKPPSNLKIWVSDFLFNQGSAPMIRRVWHPIGINGNGAWANFFANMVVGSQLSYWNFILKPVEPDITLDISGDYRKAYELTSHELAHASHFSNVGSAYWAKYISYIITYGAYGDGTGNNAELCGIGEMWGYAMEHILGYEKFEPEELTEDEYPVNTDDDWIKPDVFWDLITDGHLTKKQIFDCLTSDVDTFDELIAKMYQKYPTQADSIQATFVRYGMAPAPAPAPSITGPEVLIVSSSATFSVTNPPAGFTWNTSSNLSLTGSGNSVTVTGNSNGAGWVCIFVNGTEVARQDVLVASLLAPVISSEHVPKPGTDRINLVISVNNPIDGAVYEWQVNGAPYTTTTVSPHQLVFLSPFIIQSHRSPVSITVRCRTRIGQNVSAWSNEVQGLTGSV